MKRILLLIICVLPAVVTSLFAEEELKIAFDAACFNFDVNESRWELYYTVPDNMFIYKSDSLFHKGQILVSIKIMDASRTIIEDNWSISNVVRSIADLKHNYLFGIRSYFIPPGQYKAVISAFDNNNPMRRLTYNQDIYIAKFDNNSINQSEIEFASYISKISESSFELDHLYMKNDYYVIPNPRAEFLGDQARLIGIVEIYNTDRLAPTGFRRSYKILDNTGVGVYYSTDTCLVVSETILSKFDLPLDSIPSGVYYFSFTTHYPLDNPHDSVTSTKKFFYYNQNKPPIGKKYFTENEMFEKSEFNALTPEQTDLELNMAIVVAQEDEIHQARSLNETKAKQRFLFKFWAKRDTDTLTFWNETLRTFRQNAEFANKFFSFGKNKQGWKTERGRIILRYGAPTQRDIRITTGSERSYEEWFYENVQGGVNFYFVDVSGIGNFILVHSTALNEPYNPDWYNRYVPSTQDSRIQQDLDNQRPNTNPYGQ